MKKTKEPECYPCGTPKPTNTIPRRAFFRRALQTAKIMIAGCAAGPFLGRLSKARAGVTPVSLPHWTGASPVSDVFAVYNIPQPSCSLAGGTPTGSNLCSSQNYALSDQGIESMVNVMESAGTYFYKTTAHPDGIVGGDDVVIIKVNNQWGGAGSSTGYGRLGTNTDLLKGLIGKIIRHPEGFTGEIVVVENTQPLSSAGWGVTPANAEDQNQSIQDVIDTFVSYGHPVSLYNWTDLNNTRISGGNITDGGYPSGEYAQGNMSDAYILLHDTSAGGTNQYSYPKFRTPAGTYVSMRYGIWTGTSYNQDRLTFINMPVLKKHGMAAATVCWKNLVGFVTCADSTNRFGSDNAMHNFFWGYTGGADNDFGLLGRVLAEIRAPDLNIVDAIWAATINNWSSYAAERLNALVASTDPFAADWYASEYLLRPVVSSSAQASSAARGGTFRSATRVNQKRAKEKWSGTYPYIDMDAAYDGAAPSSSEQNQMNAYTIDSSADVIPAVNSVGFWSLLTALLGSAALFFGRQKSRGRPAV